MDFALEFCQLRPEVASALAEFFAALVVNGDTRWFHPHPFTAEQAGKLCAYCGRDLYYVALAGGTVLGYGMLRGWDEGYEVPSLGIAIHPAARGLKLGYALMHFLQSAVRYRGAKRIRLTVSKDNVAARTMYERLGYRYQSGDGAELIGFLELNS